jgi:hypothetical protein
MQERLAEHECRGVTDRSGKGPLREGGIESVGGPRER